MTQEEFDNWMDNRIESWHNSTSTKELYEYLGLTQQEYMEWVENPDRFFKKRIVRNNSMQQIDIVDFAENDLGVDLLEYQKTMLRNLELGAYPVYHRYDGRYDVLRYMMLAKLLCTE